MESALAALRMDEAAAVNAARHVKDQLKATGYPFELTIFPELGHGGLAGEHPARFVEEVTAAWQKSLA